MVSCTVFLFAAVRAIPLLSIKRAEFLRKTTGNGTGVLLHCRYCFTHPNLALAVSQHSMEEGLTDGNDDCIEARGLGPCFYSSFVIGPLPPLKICSHK